MNRIRRFQTLTLGPSMTQMEAKLTSRRELLIFFGVRAFSRLCIAVAFAGIYSHLITTRP